MNQRLIKLTAVAGLFIGGVLGMAGSFSSGFVWSGVSTSGLIAGDGV